MEFQISGTYNGNASQETISYTSVSQGSGIYNVSLSFQSAAQNNQTVLASFLVDSNNATVLSGVFEGYQFGSSVAKTEFDAFMGVFGLQEYYSGYIGVFTDSAYFKQVSQGPMTFGTTTFTVTTYGLNTAGETVNYCGNTATINDYTLQVGTPPGSQLQFITYLHYDGTSNGQTEDVTFQLVSMTVG
jgi:hypothetical protein